MNASEAIAQPRWRLIGPGLIVAATGVGAADLVATMVAGSKYGYTLLWAVVVGCLMKVVLVEGAGRYSLATGKTIYEGWSSLGKWAHAYFGPYIVVWGFVYGAAAMAGTGLALYALFPAVRIEIWGIVSALIGLVLVWGGRYGMFEKILSLMVLTMFVAVMTAAVLTVPHLGEILRGLVPTIPKGSLINVLSVAGGVGGTITLAAYGYWLREKRWSTPAFMRVMRIDNRVAYAVTGLFVVATLIVGAELLYASQIAVGEGDQAMVNLAKVLADRYGEGAGMVFLIGFWAAAMSSLLGVWHGVSLMFADFVGHVRKLPTDAPARLGGGRWYRAYILWLTFPPMLLLFFDKPVAVLLAYGVLGALFMPFLAITLIWILNTDRIPREWRNGWFANVVMALCALVFGYLAIEKLISEVAKVFGA